jgi:phage N-6-adenine-methyltransferase
VSELDQIDPARRAIEEAQTVPEVAAVVAKLEAFHTYAKKVGLDNRDENRIAAAKLAGKRKGGQLLRDLERNQGDRTDLTSPNDGTSSEYAQACKEARLSSQDASRWQKVGAVPESIFDEYVAGLLDDPEREITTTGAIAYAQSGGKLVASDENEWYTPARYIEAARAVLGDIDLDPATSETANETVKAPQIYTLADDGLAQVWHGRVWLNPPYGRLAGEFVTKLVWDHQTENVAAAVALVNAHCTDTAWFQQLWDYPLCFTDHRIDFDSGGRDKHTTSTHGSVFAYLGLEREAFAKEFGRFGAIVRRWP